MHMKLLHSCVQLFGTYVLKPTRLFCPWDSPGKNTEVGCHALFQGILQRINPVFPAAPGLLVGSLLLSH